MWYAELRDEEIYLFRLRGVPRHVAPAEDKVQQHQLSGDLRGTRPAAVAVVFLRECAIQRPRMHVVDMPTVRAAHEPLSQSTSDQAVEKIADVLAILNARERFILPPEAVATVQRDGHEE